MIVFGIGADSVRKVFKLDQFTRWYFGKSFVPFGLPKIVVVNAYGIFAGMFRKNFQDTLLIPVRAVAKATTRKL